MRPEVFWLYVCLPLMCFQPLEMLHSHVIVWCVWIVRLQDLIPCLIMFMLDWNNGQYVYAQYAQILMYYPRFSHITRLTNFTSCQNKFFLSFFLVEFFSFYINVIVVFYVWFQFSTKLFWRTVFTSYHFASSFSLQSLSFCDTAQVLHCCNMW